ncbi:MAG: dethiobiotin synthase [Deltaproteobacteria bacterium]|nr:dethiobiotin synthase [Deltaproteobacteria bacterium]
MPSLFVTGTDTGVGKTTISASLLASWRAREKRVAALKPVETGCYRNECGELFPADGFLLREACGLSELPLDAIVPYRFIAPVAPSVAARMVNSRVELPRILEAAENLAQRCPDMLLIEGAGGLLVPYSEDLLGVDIARALDASLLIVARASLGTINHTLLTIREARRQGLKIAGVVLNQVHPETGPDHSTNAQEIERIGEVPVIGTVPYLRDPMRASPNLLAKAAHELLSA